MELRPLQWKLEVITIGPLGNSQGFFFLPVLTGMVPSVHVENSLNVERMYNRMYKAAFPQSSKLWILI